MKNWFLEYDEQTLNNPIFKANYLQFRQQFSQNIVINQQKLVQSLSQNKFEYKIQYHIINLVETLSAFFKQPDISIQNPQYTDLYLFVNNFLYIEQIYMIDFWPMRTTSQHTNFILDRILATLYRFHQFLIGLHRQLLKHDVQKHDQGLSENYGNQYQVGSLKQDVSSLIISYQEIKVLHEYIFKAYNQLTISLNKFSNFYKREIEFIQKTYIILQNYLDLNYDQITELSNTFNPIINNIKNTILQNNQQHLNNLKNIKQQLKANEYDLTLDEAYLQLNQYKYLDYLAQQLDEKISFEKFETLQNPNNTENITKPSSINKSPQSQNPQLIAHDMSINQIQEEDIYVTPQNYFQSLYHAPTNMQTYSPYLNNFYADLYNLRDLQINQKEEEQQELNQKQQPIDYPLIEVPNSTYKQTKNQQTQNLLENQTADNINIQQKNKKIPIYENDQLIDLILDDKLIEQLTLTLAGKDEETLKQKQNKELQQKKRQAKQPQQKLLENLNEIFNKQKSNLADIINNNPVLKKKTKIDIANPKDNTNTNSKLRTQNSGKQVLFTNIFNPNPNIKPPKKEQIQNNDDDIKDEELFDQYKPKRRDSISSDISEKSQNANEKNQQTDYKKQFIKAFDEMAQNEKKAKRNPLTNSEQSNLRASQDIFKKSHQNVKSKWILVKKLVNELIYNKKIQRTISVMKPLIHNNFKKTQKKENLSDNPYQ